MYTFIALLIAILQDEESYAQFMDKLTQHVIDENRAYDIAVRNKQARPAKHLTPPFPCCYTRNRVSSVAAAWLNQCRIMAMQFVIMKPTLIAVPYFLQLAGYDYYASENAPLLDHNAINWRSAQLYVVFAMNVSVALAFYGLLAFFHGTLPYSNTHINVTGLTLTYNYTLGTEKDLAWCEPWPKFLCIKGVVFMTFWQGIAIQVSICMYTSLFTY